MKLDVERMAEVVVQVIAKSLNARVGPLEERVRALMESNTALKDQLATYSGYHVQATEKIAALEGRGLRYREVFVPGTEYQKGDAVTYGGSMWVARQATKATPGEAKVESRAWVMAVIRGRDGKDTTR